MMSFCLSSRFGDSDLRSNCSLLTILLSLTLGCLFQVIPSPFKDVHVVTTTTHKTLRGTRYEITFYIILNYSFIHSLRWSPIQVLTTPDPPLPPILYSLWFPFTFASWVTANVVFLVHLFIHSSHPSIPSHPIHPSIHRVSHPML